MKNKTHMSRKTLHPYKVLASTQAVWILNNTTLKQQLSHCWLSILKL